jgi:hypothetical protein
VDLVIAAVVLDIHGASPAATSRFSRHAERPLII